MTSTIRQLSVEHMSEYGSRADTAEWLWRVSDSDEHIANNVYGASTVSDFAVTEAERDWHIRRLVSYGATRDELVVEHVPGPYLRAIADDRERRRQIIATHREQQAERRARHTGDTPVTPDWTK